MRFCDEAQQTQTKSEVGAKFYRRHIINLSRIKFCETSFADGFASCNKNLMKYSG